MRNWIWWTSRDVHTIKNFEAPELGVTFSYYTPKEKHMAPKEVRSTRARHKRNLQRK